MIALMTIGIGVAYKESGAPLGAPHNVFMSKSISGRMVAGMPARFRAWLGLATLLDDLLYRLCTCARSSSCCEHQDT